MPRPVLDDTARVFCQSRMRVFFPVLFRSDKIEAANAARVGRSSRSLITGGAVRRLGEIEAG